MINNITHCILGCLSLALDALAQQRRGCMVINIRPLHTRLSIIGSRSSRVAEERAHDK